MSDDGPFSSLCSRNFHERLFENILALDNFLDAVLSAEGQRIQVHRFVLAAGSKYFCKLLKCNKNSNNLPIFVFTDIRFEHMKRIVQYLYTGKTQIRSDELDEFFRVANQLEILGLYHESNLDDLSIVSESMSSMANSTFDSVPPVLVPDRNSSKREPTAERKRQEYKRTMNLRNGVNNSVTNNPQPRTSQTAKNDRKRRVERPNEVAESKKRSVFISTATNPSDQRNGTSSKSNEKTAREARKSINDTNSRTDKVVEQNQQNTDAGPSSEPNGNEELQRSDGEKSGKVKQFECRTCRKSFYLRICLKTHQCDNSTCGPPTESDDAN